MADRGGRFWPAVATIVGVALTIALGSWQLGRAAEKRELKVRFDAQATQPPIHIGNAEIPAADLEWRNVEATGVFEPRYAVYLDNRIREGRPGYEIIMPLRIERGERYVLVDRGWIAAGEHRSQLPKVPTPTSVVYVSGVAVVPGRHIFELSRNVVEGVVWQNVTIARYRKAMPISIQPFMIRQESSLTDGLVRKWDPPDFGIEKHYGYAFQWFALGTTLSIFYAVTQLKRKRSAAS